MIKIALPAGDLRAPIADLLTSAGLRIEGYGEGSRSYRLQAAGRGDVVARVFRERDIPIQVALGNYDLGICNYVWVKEIAARFPAQPVVPLAGLGVGNCTVFATCAAGTFSSISDLNALPTVRMASEFPNLAEAFALAARFPRYRVQAVWGSAEGYPPEDADLVLVSARQEGDLSSNALAPVHRLMESSACVIANAESLRRKSLLEALAPLRAVTREHAGDGLVLPSPQMLRPTSTRTNGRGTTLRLALPDGHQQRHVVEALRSAGVEFEGYDDTTCVRRPKSPVEGLEVKVVRPHDMPQLVAAGQIDLAITGRDCLMEHRYRFPSSPAVEVIDLQRGQYDLCAVVSEDLAGETIDSALGQWRAEGKPYVRIASEFPATADYYARSRHIWRYQVIPIAGASEGFVPEDAELLIEGTETGKTLRENRLRAIDRLYRSTTCVIGHQSPELAGRRAEVHKQLLDTLSRSVAA
jgi:ATP phosphoribosyltransferase